MDSPQEEGGHRADEEQNALCRMLSTFPVPLPYPWKLTT